jgi:hypothetical protein
LHMIKCFKILKLQDIGWHFHPHKNV